MNLLAQRFILLSVMLFIGVISVVHTAEAAPMFARKYKLTCVSCHAAFPKLNAFGQQFADMNYRLPNWKETTVPTGDDLLALPDEVPMAVRAQAFAQSREAQTIDVTSGATSGTKTDLQAPYLIKLLSSAPLSEHISYYFYGIMAEKGSNGEMLIEDAWVSHDDIFGSGIGMMLGQFQVSDLMFPRETRLTFQDYMAYRMAGITYDRGVIFSREVGPVDVSLGLVNGNGISSNTSINSAGYRRPDHSFDDDDAKSTFGRVGFGMGPVDGGIFFLSGQQKNAIGVAGTSSGIRDTTKTVTGLDFSGQIGPKTYWFAQYLINQWDGFITDGVMYEWPGAFVGVDHVASDRWTYSFLFNYADGSAFDGSDTIYEGIDINSLTVTASYYFMRNAKGVIEVNLDMLPTEAQSGSYYTGHLASENYVLVGFDVAF